MKDLKNVRTEINKVDEELAKLFEKRMDLCKEVAAYKHEHGLPVKDHAREKEILENCKSRLTESEYGSYYVQFVKNVIDLSCQYQNQILNGMKVTFSGVEGAFAHIAAKKLFPSAEITAFSNFSDAYSAVENGEYDCAVLPIENSYAGEVGTVMDLVFSGSLYINQVIEMPIEHNLIAVEGAKLSEIKTVISHPQALDQCGDYIKKHGFETKAFSNTAAAAKYVKELGDPTVAAIASDDTAGIFDLSIVDTVINDSKNNTTRFGVFSRTQNLVNKTNNRDEENFILMFTVKNEAGALAQTLNIIGAHGFNMRNLRSRPMKELQWSYFFYIEAEGNINTENGSDMLRELSAVCAKLKLVGSYSSM